MSTKTLDNTPANARQLLSRKVAGDKPAEDQRFDRRELFRPALPNSEETANKSGVPTVGSSAKKGTMHRTPDKLPDPWLFESEALLRELDRCRELVLQIPIDNPQATHFGINNAISAIWNLTQTLRFLLHLHRDGQRAFGAKAEREMAANAALSRDQIKRDKFRKSADYLTCVAAQKKLVATARPSMQKKNK